MKQVIKLGLAICAVMALVSCADSAKPNFQYMPNMYEPVGYETYGNYEVFPNQMSAMLPAEGSVPRGFQPYDYPNTTEGLELARVELLSPIDVTEESLAEGKKLYDIYCAVCHGDKGDGKGILAQRDKINGIPSYADAGRTITMGGTYHVQMFGLNSMGSYASQTNELERWQIAQHVMNLKASMLGTPLMVPAVEDAMEGQIENNAVETHVSEEQH